MPFFSHTASLLALSSLLTGLLTPATVFISSYSLLQIYEQRYQKLWSIATIGFASTQLLGGVVISTLHHLHWSYAHLFLLGGTVLLFAVCLLIPPTPFFHLNSRRNQTVKTLLFPLFLVAFVLIIQALDQSYQKKTGFIKSPKHPEFMQ